MLKTQSMAKNNSNRYERYNSNNNNKQLNYSFNPNSYLSFTDLKNKLKPNHIELESSHSSICNLSTTSLQRKTLKPINQNQLYTK